MSLRNGTASTANYNADPALTYRLLNRGAHELDMIIHTRDCGIKPGTPPLEDASGFYETREPRR